jgi:hypothetical protein
MNPPRIALIHATTLAMQPVQDVFGQLWPEAQCRNLLDDSLTADLAAAGRLNTHIYQRILDLAQYAQAQNVHGILFTCSAFGSAIEAAQAGISIPVLKPNQAMFEEAIEQCRQLGGQRKIGLLTSFAPATHAMMEELEEELTRSKSPIQAISACEPDAMELLKSGDAAGHDQKLRAAALAMPLCDVYLLGQFSMACAQACVQQALARPVLSSPASAVRSLQRSIRA